MVYIPVLEKNCRNLTKSPFHQDLRSSILAFLGGFSASCILSMSLSLVSSMHCQCHPFHNTFNPNFFLFLHQLWMKDLKSNSVLQSIYFVTTQGPLGVDGEQQLKKSGIVVQAFHHSTWDVETGKSIVHIVHIVHNPYSPSLAIYHVLGQPGPHKFLFFK